MPSEASPILFYSNNCRQDLKEIFCLSLQRAKKSIYLSTYGLSDPHILTLLQNKIREGLSITITCHPREISSIQKLLGTSVKIVPCQSSGLNHEKITILDNKIVFLGSTNLTETSLSLHDNILIGIFSHNLANHLLTRIPGGRCALSIKQQNLSFYFLPEKDKFTLNHILSVIGRAQEEIQIALFTFTHPEIQSALVQARMRGVKITVLMDQFLARGCCKKTVDTLKQANCITRTSNSHKLMHHKWARIDRTTFIVGSANWTKSAFVKNRDYILIINCLDKTQNTFIDNLWANLYRHSTL